MGKSEYEKNVQNEAVAAVERRWKRQHDAERRQRLRKMFANLLAILVFMVGLVGIACFAVRQYGVEIPLAKDKVAIVGSKEMVNGHLGYGTGFLCAMGGRKYFVTNKHVADHSEDRQGKLRVSFQNGFKLEFGPNSIVEVAKNRDLVRFEISTDRDVLAIADDIPDVGDSVEFYGNAKGGGVITVTTGKILAVGLERIEIDSPIQDGNSGSPLIRVSDGKVVGVTTLSTYNNLREVDNDPSMKGTRYDPRIKLTREFAVRFESVAWERRKYAAFQKMPHVRDDLCRFADMLDGLCFKENRDLVLDYKVPDIKFEWCKELNLELAKIERADTALHMAKDRYNEMKLRTTRKAANREERLTYYSKREWKNAVKNIKDKTIESLTIRVEVMESFLTLIKRSKALEDDERKAMMKRVDQLIRYYQHENRMRFKGLDLPDIPIIPQ